MDKKRLNKLFCVFVVIFISFIFSSTLLLAQTPRPSEDIRDTVMQLQRLIKEKTRYITSKYKTKAVSTNV